MNKPMIALAAAALALGLAPAAEAGFSLRLPGAASVVHKAGCDEDCAEYVEELAEEAEAPEYDEEEVYVPRARAVERRPRAEPAARKASAPDADVDRAAAKSPSAFKKDDEDTAEPKTSDSKRAVAVVSPGNCKQYFPSVGMTLSVPCE
jgi:hypothetical protein